MMNQAITHIAVIMDGNRRWALQNNVDFLYGDESSRAVHDVINVCIQRGVKYLSLYTLSLENLEQRDTSLLNRLFTLLITRLEQHRDQWAEQNIKVRFIGQQDVLPDSLVDVITSIEETTADATGLTLNILLGYGSQQEIVSATRQIAQKVANGQLAADAITREVFAEHLWSAPSPPVDMIIRTGGYARLSNFLLYQAAYSELLFVDYLWPDMNADRFEECLAQFDKVKRNYGA